MSVQTPVDKTSPLWKAWEAYKVTEHYANTKKWAATSHVEGSLWAAFERGFAAAAVERGVRETSDGPSQSELDAWRKRATEAETEAAEYQRILCEAHEAALKSPAVNSGDRDDPRLTELRNLATKFASVRESVWMGVTGSARSGACGHAESEREMNKKPIVLCFIHSRQLRLFGLYVGRWRAATVWATTRKQAVRRGRSRRYTPQIPDDWRPRLRAKLERR